MDISIYYAKFLIPLFLGMIFHEPEVKCYPFFLEVGLGKLAAMGVSRMMQARVPQTIVPATNGQGQSSTYQSSQGGQLGSVIAPQMRSLLGQETQTNIPQNQGSTNGQQIQSYQSQVQPTQNGIPPGYHIEMMPLHKALRMPSFYSTVQMQPVQPSGNTIQQGTVVQSSPTVPQPSIGTEFKIERQPQYETSPVQSAPPTINTMSQRRSFESPQPSTESFRSEFRSEQLPPYSTRSRHESQYKLPENPQIPNTNQRFYSESSPPEISHYHESLPPNPVQISGEPQHSESYRYSSPPVSSQHDVNIQRNHPPNSYEISSTIPGNDGLLSTLQNLLPKGLVQSMQKNYPGQSSHEHQSQSFPTNKDDIISSLQKLIPKGQNMPSMQQFYPGQKSREQQPQSYPTNQDDIMSSFEKLLPKNQDRPKERNNGIEKSDSNQDLQNFLKEFQQRNQ